MKTVTALGFTIRGLDYVSNFLRNVKRERDEKYS